MPAGGTFRLTKDVVAYGTSGDDTFYGNYNDVEGSIISGLAYRDHITLTDAYPGENNFFSFDRVNSNLGLQYTLQSGYVVFGYIHLQEDLVGRLAVTVNPVQGLDIFVSPLTATQDFNGDGHSDVVFRDAAGALNTWHFVGDDAPDQVVKNTYSTSISTSWHIAAAVNADDDGVSDLLWRNDSGMVSLWTGTRQGFNQGAFTSEAVSNSWHIAAVGDMDGNRRDDILWRNDDSSISIWSAKPVLLGYIENTYFHSPVGIEWKIAGMSDFNGDGRSDIVFRNDNGDVSVWTEQLKQVSGSSYSTSANDAANSGVTPTYVNTYIENTFYQHVDNSWHIAGFGDFNGDSKGDILWLNNNGDLTVWQSTGSAFLQSAFNSHIPSGWHVGQVGDYNGDGLSDIMFRNDSGAISIWHSTSSGFDQNTFYDSSVPNTVQIAGASF